MTAKKLIVRRDTDRARILFEVEAAMRALPLPSLPAKDKKGKRFRITSSHDVREPIIVHLAEKYCDMMDAPDPPPARKAVEAEFATLAKRARALRESLTHISSHRHAAAIQAAMGDHAWTRATLLRELDSLIDAAGRAEVPTAKSRKGPAQDAYALQIAQAAWADYRQLTGKPLSATRDTGGGFPAFLDKILKARGRTDSAENLAKAVDRPLRGEAAGTEFNAGHGALDRILQGVAAPVDLSIKNEIASPRSWASLIKMK
jgi:hypothetical protein